MQVEVAGVQEQEIGDDEAAIDAYRQALGLDPRNAEALAALERLYTKLDRPADLLAIYERQLELTEDYRERVKILFQCAAIWEDRYQNPANADACIEGVLALDPTNLQAIKALERLRRAQGRWEELVGVLERHIQLATDGEEQADLMVEAGDVFDRSSTRRTRPRTRSRPRSASSPVTLRRCTRWARCTSGAATGPSPWRCCTRRRRRWGATRARWSCSTAWGRSTRTCCIDVASAKACYTEALRIDPDYLPSLRALKGIYETEQDWESYEQTLVAEAQATRRPRPRPGRYSPSPATTASAARTPTRRCTGTRRRSSSTPSWPRPRCPWPTSTSPASAGSRRSRCWTSSSAASRAGWPAEQDDALGRDLCRQVYRLGYVQEKLGRRDRALAAYEEAYQLDATYLPALEGYGNLLVQTGRHDEALKVFQTILIHHREDLTDLEIVEIYWQIGDVHIALKQHDRAQNHFEKALAIDPGHEPSLRALIQLADGAGRWDNSAEYRQALVERARRRAQGRGGPGAGRSSPATSSTTRTRPSTPSPRRCASAPQSLEVMDALYVLYRETRQPAEGGRDAGDDARPARAPGRRTARQAGVVRAGREPAATSCRTPSGRWRPSTPRWTWTRCSSRPSARSRRMLGAAQGVEAAGGELRPDDPAAPQDRRHARRRAWRCGGRWATSTSRCSSSRRAR